MRQYEIRWAELPPPIGRRPVLILTRSPGIPYLSRLLVAEITTTVRGIPQEVVLGRREGLARPSAANLDSIAAVRKRLLGERIGALASQREAEVKRALGFALGWPELQSLA